MGHHTDRQTGCTPAVRGLTLFAGMLVVFLLIAGGAATLLYFRLRAGEQMARVERERAFEAAKQAQQLAEEAQRRARASSENAVADAAGSSADEGSEVTIEIDGDGNPAVAGTPVAIADLTTTLLRFSERAGGAASVVIKVDNRCLFEHVAKVLTTCEEAGIEDVRVRSAEDPSNAADEPDSSTQ